MQRILTLFKADTHPSSVASSSPRRCSVRSGSRSDEPPLSRLGLHGSVLVLSMLFAALLAGGAWASELVESIRRVRPSIIAVGTFKPTASPQFTFRGTGFAVGDGSMVVTNAHVLPKSVDLDAYESIAIAIPGDDGPGASGRKAELLASDPEHDLALLKISGPPLVPLALASDGLVEEGELVAFTGFPIGSVLGLIPVTHRGIVSAVTPIVMPGRSAGNSMPEHPLAEGSVPGLPARRHRLSGQQRQPALQAGQQRGDRAYQHGSGEGHQESVLSQPSGISYAIPSRYIHELMKR